MKFTREQYLELMTFGDFSRLMFSEIFGLLVGLPAEWRAQGANQQELALADFGWDYVSSVYCGANTGVFNGFKPEIIEENSEYLIQRDEIGRTTKLCKAVATDPLPLDYPVKDMDSWLKIKYMFEFNEGRINWDQVELAKRRQAAGDLVVGVIPGGFDMPRALMGEENLCLAYYSEPELITDMLNTFLGTSLKVLRRTGEKILIDQVIVHEDLAGKSGPLIGPKQTEEFIKPYFSKIWELISSNGTKLFEMDSDGDINPLIDIFVESGINSILPFEPAAGMDIVKVRTTYGKKLAIRGGIDKHVLRGTKEDIREELEYKMQTEIWKAGGIVFGLDHRITNGTPLENYRYYVDLGREILGLPPKSQEKAGWARIAF